MKLNTVIVEGGYMSGIPAKKHVQIKIHCKSIQPLRGQYWWKAPFMALTALSVFWVGLYQLCTVRWGNLCPFFM